MTAPLPKALICGTVRNGGKRIEKTVLKLSQVFGERFDLSFFVVESDSSDSTVEVLHRLKAGLESFDFKSLGAIRDELPDRLERIAFCRNVYMEHFDRASDGVSFLITADMDGINLGLSKESLDFLDDESLLWGAACANQAGPYYDIGALRVSGWNDSDPFMHLKTLTSAGLPFELSQKIAVESKMVVIPSSTSPFPVESAYGGLVIYESTAAKGCKYSTGDYGEVEIVNFNREFSSNSHKPIMLIPGFINSRYTEHTAQFSLLGRALYKSTRMFRRLAKRFAPQDLLEKLSEMERRMLGR